MATAPDTSDTPPDAWCLRLLGGFELRRGATLHRRLPTRPTMLLLARLALHPERDHPREQLIDLLWPEATLSVGRNRLRQALSVLRSVLEADAAPGAAPTVQGAGQLSLRLAPGAVQCDALQLREAIAAGDATAVAALARGELMPGFYDDWVLQERRALEALLEATLSPAPAAARALPPRSTGVPAYLTRWIGEPASIDAVVQQVIEQRLVVLRGPGGGGKTRLAVQALRRLEERLPQAFDRIVFVPLAAARQAQDLYEAVARALGARSAGEPLHRLRDSLDGLSALLVLDNFEALATSTADELPRWLTTLPGLHLLVTSRRALALDGVHELPLQSLRCPPVGAGLADVRASAAAALFVDRARALVADFVLDAGNHAEIGEVVRLLQGLPLAIELAAARLRSLGLSELLAVLRQGRHEPRAALTLLSRAGQRAGDDPRQASMLAVIADSAERLSAPAYALLEALALRPGGCTLASAAALGPSGSALADAIDYLDELVASSVAYTVSDSDGQQRMHPFEPVREFMLMRMSATRQAELRLAWLAVAERTCAGLGVAPDLFAFDAELPNLLQAFADADAARQGRRVLAMVVDCAAALDDITLPPSALALIRGWCTLHSDEVAGRVHALLAQQCYEVGQPQQAWGEAQQALAKTDSRSRHRAAAVFVAARLALRIHDDLTAASAWIDEGLSLSLQRNDWSLHARLLTLLGVLVARRDQDHLRKLQLDTRAVALWRQHGPATRLPEGLVNLALAHGSLRQPEAQLPLLEEALALTRASGQRRLQAFVLSVMASALADLRRWTESHAAQQACLQLAWQHSAWREWFYGLWNLPLALVALGEPQRAAEILAFAEQFGQARFGPLAWNDLRVLRRTRRLLHRALGANNLAEAWRVGQALGTAQAMVRASSSTRVD